MSTSGTSINLSSRAWFYFFGYHFYQILKKYAFWVLMASVLLTTYRIIRTSQVFGMSEKDMALAYLEPLPIFAKWFIAIVGLLAIVKAVVQTFSTHYNLTRSGLVVESGLITKHTTIVALDQIQKITIISNPFDRLLKTAYLHVDLIGGAPGIGLEAIDADTVRDIRGKLDGSRTKLIASTPEPKQVLLPKRKKRKSKKRY
ncbi:PH domain-containing protein [Candidatus Saccharibacteria bacterium]|nr:PH domain-containing protein [Candidatus Saccharibacteria bacterium]